MKATLCIDDAVGEHRRALVDDAGKPFRLEIERWSERGHRARLDETWWGRARARLPGGTGWFVDLGLDADGVIEATKSTAITEGALIAVRIKSEAWAGKGAGLSLADMSPATPRPDRPGLHAKPASDPFLAGMDLVETLDGAAARERVDAAIEEAQQTTVQLDGGGDIAIERTRALTAIDVDAGGRIAADGARLAFELNRAAALEAARQIALRGTGGLVVIDFVSMPSRKNSEAVAAAFRHALASRLGRASEVSELSRLGLCETAIARRVRPVRDALAATSPAEREALEALRAIESEGWAAPGARIRALVSRAAADWLEADPIGWKQALLDRIGGRWTLEAVDHSPGRPDVRSAR